MYVILKQNKYFHSYFQSIKPLKMSLLVSYPECNCCFAFLQLWIKVIERWGPFLRDKASQKNISNKEKIADKTDLGTKL